MNEVTAHFIERAILVVNGRGAAILLNFAEPDSTVEELLADFPELLQPNVILEREVYAHFGLLYMGFALLEHSMINVVTIKQNITTLKKYPRPNATLWESHFDGSFAYAAAQTFGNLSKMVAAIPEFKDLGEGLLKVKKTRDYFSHHFFRRAAAHMSERQSALELLVDINRARLLVKMVEMEMTPRYSQYLKRLGLPVLSESAIDKEAEKLSQNEREKLASGILPRGVARWLNRGQED